MIFYISSKAVRLFTVPQLVPTPERLEVRRSPTGATLTPYARDVLKELRVLSLDTPAYDAQWILGRTDCVVPNYWHRGLGTPFVFDICYGRSNPRLDPILYSDIVMRYQLHIEDDSENGSTVPQARVEVLNTFTFAPSSVSNIFGSNMVMDTFNPQRSHFFLTRMIPRRHFTLRPIVVAVEYSIEEPGLIAGGEPAMAQGMMTAFHRYQKGDIPNWSLCPVTGRMVEARALVRDPEALGVEEQPQRRYQYYVHDFLN